MRKKTVLLFGVFVLTTAIVVFAQHRGWFHFTVDETKLDAKEEFKKVMTVLNSPDSVMHISGTMRVYDQENKNKLQEQSSFLVEKTNQSFYSRLGYVQTIGVDSFLIEIDTVNQLIGLSRADVSMYHKRLSNAIAIDQFLEDSAVFKMELSVREINQTDRAITIKNPLTPEIKLSTIYYDANTYRIKKAETDWWKSGMPEPEKKDEQKTWHSEVSYIYSRMLTVSAVEKMKAVVEFANGVVSVKPAYKNYQLTTSF
ncbi:hypothetical protein [Lacibacter sp.]|uniref:hypothetical protein n=1 Tax=Lacibacter sp. TaxID=1915409 RepID=UPI002B4B11E3|nr:hypothetical protein [Lacibacter sp.]HLP39531.1 hypothetical protein [Lacibacter sp.]